MALLAGPTGAPILNRFLSRRKDTNYSNTFQVFLAIILCFYQIPACNSKNFLYFCNQVLANRRDTTLLRQTNLSPREGAGMILVG